MATGRTLSRWSTLYIGGYRITGSTKSFGPLSVIFNPVDVSVMNDSIKGSFPTRPNVTLGTINAIMNTFNMSNIEYVHSGIPTLQTAGTALPVSAAIGIRTAPAAGDPCFNGYFRIIDYTLGVETDGSVPITINLSEWDPANMINYEKVWGNVVHAYSQETGANTGTGIDGGAATTAGGYLVYMGYSDATNFTISIDDSANNVDFLALSGATSGAVSGSPSYGIVQLGTTATVRRYLRWQLAKTGGTYVEFYLSFVRG